MKLLIFDIDGTLTHLDGSTFRAFQVAFQEIFGRETITDGVKLHGRTDPLIFRDCYRNADLNGDWQADYEAFKPAYIRALPEMIRANERARTKPGVPELLEKLASLPDRCKLTLGTGNGEAGARVKIGHFNLNHYFPVGGFGDAHEERSFIMRDAVRTSEAHYGITFDPEQTWVIGDTVFDIEGGKAIGLKTFGVATGGAYTFEDLEQSGADVVFRDLSDTTGVLRALELD